MIQVQCSGCRTRYSLKDEYAGKKVRCKKCKQPIAVPQIDSGELDPPELGFLEEAESRGTVVAAPAMPAGAGARQTFSGYTMPTPSRVPVQRDDVLAAPSRVAQTTVPTAFAGVPGAAYRAPGRRRSQVFDDPSLNTLTIALLVLFSLGAIILPILIFTLDNHGVTNEIAIPVTIISIFFFYFGIVTPGTMAGVWLTYKLFQLPTPPKLYLRAAGVHLLFYVLAIALQIPIGLVAGVLGAMGVPPIVVIGVLLISIAVQIRVLFWSYHRYFETTALQSLVAMIFAWIVTSIVFAPAMFLAFEVFKALAVPEGR